jgi:hypothetical protein
MSTKLIAVTLTTALLALGVLAFTNSNPATTYGARDTVTSSNAAPMPVQNADASEAAYLSDFRQGYVEGFTSGVSGYTYPDQQSLSGRSGGYLGGFEQGYADGQNQQAVLRERLCSNLSTGPAGVTGYAPYSGRTGTTRTLGARAYNRERPDLGIGSTARKALLIGGGAAAGAGLGAALGGKKGAAIGALVGGGTGTALALTKKPSRAFNRRVSGKTVLTRTLIGAGAGAAIGALAGGKRGAAAGAGLGGGGGVLWSLLDGKRVTRR